MPDTSLHLPPDWERKEGVIRLDRRIGALGSEQMPLAALAPLYFLRMWTEWASNPQDWRPLNARVENAATHAWVREDLTFIIERACEWRGPGCPPGALLVCAIEAGVYQIVERGDLSGLAMEDWVKLNLHLMEGYESMQARGGKTTRLKKARDMATKMAAQQMQVFEAQGFLLLNHQTTNAEEQKAALTLVIQLDRHCGLVTRSGSQYSETVLRDAVGIIRRHQPADVEKVLAYVRNHRTNPSVVTIPEVILAGFDEYLEEAGKAS